jgi:hypothetical protein
MGLSHTHHRTLLVSISNLWKIVSISNDWIVPGRVVKYSTIPVATPSAANSPQACRICSHQIAGPDRQNHMGGHILRCLRNVEESFQNMGIMVRQSISHFRDSTLMSRYSLRFHGSIHVDSVANRAPMGHVL